MGVLRRGAAGLVLAGAVAWTALAEGPAPVKLAVFNFELDDFSPAISSGATDPADTAALAEVTAEVRKLAQESGRYALVAIDGAAVASVKTLRDCNGCDAPLARKLGAEQSLVGVVKRISRTEYQIRFELRDTETGRIVAEADTGLRMGAVDSWVRGARRLIKDRLLKDPS